MFSKMHASAKVMLWILLGVFIVVAGIFGYLIKTGKLKSSADTGIQGGTKVTLNADKTQVTMPNTPVVLTWSYNIDPEQHGYSCRSNFLGQDFASNGQMTVFPVNADTQYKLICFVTSPADKLSHDVIIVTQASVSIQVLNPLPEPKHFTINTTANPSNGGQVITADSVKSDNGVFTVLEGSQPTFYFVPSSKFKNAGINIDGVGLGNLSSYTFGSINSNHTLDASFSQMFTITPSMTPVGGGSISPSDPQDVEPLGSKMFTIIPNFNYVADVWADNTDLGNLSTYTFNNVAADHTIRVTFSPVAKPNITLFNASPATAGASNSVTVNPGDMVNIQWTSQNAVKCQGQEDSSKPYLLTNWVNSQLSPTSPNGGSSFFPFPTASQTGTTTFWLTCYNSAGIASNTSNHWTINVRNGVASISLSTWVDNQTLKNKSVTLSGKVVSNSTGNPISKRTFNLGLSKTSFTIFSSLGNDNLFTSPVKLDSKAGTVLYYRACAATLTGNGCSDWSSFTVPK